MGCINPTVPPEGDGSLLCSEIVTVNSNQRGGQAATLTCKRWSCPLCRPDNRKRVIGLAKRGDPDKFLTLTIRHSDWETPDSAACGMRDAWAKMVRLIRKTYPSRRLEYLRVFEAHKSGWPHMHILMRAPFIPQAWLSAKWEELTGAFKVDIRAVEQKEKAAYYVAKYIGKDLHRFQGVTRYYRSQGYNGPREDEPIRHLFGQHWFRVNKSPQHYFWQQALELERRGAVIEERRVGYMLWSNPLVPT